MEMFTAKIRINEREIRSLLHYFFTASASILEVTLKDAKNRVEVKIGQRFFGNCRPTIKKIAERFFENCRKVFLLQLQFLCYFR